MTPKSIYLRLFLALVAAAFVFAVMYHIDLNRPVVRHGTYLKYMHEAIALVNEVNGNAHIKDVAFGPKNWSNSKDYGSKKDWEELESDCFVVYYQKDDQLVWKRNAKDVVEELQRKKNSIHAFMDPQRVNDRKIPVYLPAVDSVYDELVSKLAGDSVVYRARNREFGGYMASEFGPLGYMVRGIILKPASFDVREDQTGSYMATLRTFLDEYQMLACTEELLHIVGTPEISRQGLSGAYHTAKDCAGSIGEIFANSVKEKDSTFVDVLEKFGVSGAFPMPDKAEEMGAEAESS